MNENEYMKKIQATIAKHGVAIQGVFATEGEPGLNFSYTVGLTAHDHPEFIIFGLDPMRAARILNALARPVLDTNVRWQLGPNLEVFRGYPAELVEVVDSTEYLNVANELYAEPLWANADRKSVDAIQVVYPDAEGLWPWEPGSRVLGQPVLGRHL